MSEIVRGIFICLVAVVVAIIFLCITVFSLVPKNLLNDIFALLKSLIIRRHLSPLPNQRQIKKETKRVEKMLIKIHRRHRVA